jgi:type II secretory pathway pseudopilin PulG
MKTHRIPNRRKRGFSFVEVLCGVFLVTCCAAIVAAAMPVATVGRTKARYVNLATGLVQKELELIRGRGYPNITSSALASAGLIDSATEVDTATYSFTAVDSGPKDEVSRVLPSGVGRVKIEQADLELRRITVWVTWSERGVTKTYQSGTLVANL